MSKRNRNSKSVYNKLKKSLPMLDRDQINELINIAHNLMEFELNVPLDQKSKIYESAISLICSPNKEEESK